MNKPRIYTLSEDELKDILEKHLKWFKGEKGGERADLSGTDLRWTDLRGADLSGTDLRGTNLRGANLRGTDLRGANLRGANLSGTDLRGANLRWTDLRGADLRWTDLRGADLSGADLRGANLLYFTYNRHTAYFTFDNNIRIGCLYNPIKWWLENYESIGKDENYTAMEVMAYKNFIDLCATLQNKKENTDADTR